MARAANEKAPIAVRMPRSDALTPAIQKAALAERKYGGSARTAGRKIPNPLPLEATGDRLLHGDYPEKFGGLGSCCLQMKRFCDGPGEGRLLDEKRMCAVLMCSVSPMSNWELLG